MADSEQEQPTRTSSATPMADSKQEQPARTSSEEEVKAPNVIERAKEELEAASHSEKSPVHHKETHGTSDDIDETTPVDKVKGPSVMQRMKEEIEAFVESVNAKKDSD